MQPVPELPASALPAPVQPNHTSTKILTIAQLIVSGLGMAFSLLLAGLLLLIGLVGIFGQTTRLDSAVPVFAMAWVALLVTVLSAPSLVLSILRLMDKEVHLPRIPTFVIASTLLLLWPLVLVVGNMVADSNSSLTWLIIPPLIILAISIPIWWLVEFARRGISMGRPQRGWGVLDFSIFITTPAVIVIETLILIAIAVVAVVWISSQPGLLEQLQQLTDRLSNGPPDPEALLDLMQPYLQSPLVLISTLALLAGIIPMVEELFKPLAIWLLVGRQMNPAQGFVAGALCGGSFALLESLLTVSGTVEPGWATLVMGRAGTGLLHITTTALVGSALARAWQNRAYGRLALTFLFASLLHGVWNALSILMGLGGLIDRPPASLNFLIGLSRIAPFLLGALVLILFLLLWRNHQRLRQEAAFPLAPAQPVLPAAPVTLPVQPMGRASTSAPQPAEEPIQSSGDPVQPS